MISAPALPRPNTAAAFAGTGITYKPIRAHCMEISRVVCGVLYGVFQPSRARTCCGPRSSPPRPADLTPALGLKTGVELGVLARSRDRSIFAAVSQSMTCRVHCNCRLFLLFLSVAPSMLMMCVWICRVCTRARVRVCCATVEQHSGGSEDRRGETPAAEQTTRGAASLLLLSCIARRSEIAEFHFERHYMYEPFLCDPLDLF
eukprot:COSAG05_NODE_584_length_8527_cov_46.366279_3_plen_203_part_00